MTRRQLVKNCSPTTGWIIIAVVIILIPLLACANSPTTNSTMFSDKNNNSHVTVPVNQIFEIHLTANLGTGFSWRLNTTYDESITQSLGDRLLPNPKDTKKDTKVGVQETQIFTFKALKQGATTITLHYARPWEKEAPPTKTYSITIEVK